MWVATTSGFYSVVEDDGRYDPMKKGMLAVRARVKDDLQPLVDRYGVEIMETRYADYEYRVWLYKTQWAGFLQHEAHAIDYPNFKSAVTKAQGWERHDVYMDVWSALLRGLKYRSRRRKQRDPAQGSLIP